jgi:hypothetical protein
MPVKKNKKPFGSNQLGMGYIAHDNGLLVERGYCIAIRSIESSVFGLVTDGSVLKNVSNHRGPQDLPPWLRLSLEKQDTGECLSDHPHRHKGDFQKL